MWSNRRDYKWKKKVESIEKRVRLWVDQGKREKMGGEGDCRNTDCISKVVWSNGKDCTCKKVEGVEERVK